MKVKLFFLLQIIGVFIGTLFLDGGVFLRKYCVALIALNIIYLIIKGKCLPRYAIVLFQWSPLIIFIGLFIIQQFWLS